MATIVCVCQSNTNIPELYHRSPCGNLVIAGPQRAQCFRERIMLQLFTGYPGYIASAEDEGLRYKYRHTEYDYIHMIHMNMILNTAQVSVFTFTKKILASKKRPLLTDTHTHTQSASESERATR